MATSISFTDSVGAATLNNGKPVPADRFSNWVPNQRPIGPVEHELGTGKRHAFVFRTDYTASFELQHVPVASMAAMLRLQYHLESGGEVVVNTGDAASRSYATCCLAPGASVDITLADPVNLEYTISMKLLNVAASPAAMLCVYRA